MNIKEAKEQIKEAVSIYLMKDEDGEYRIPIEKQRPVFLLGAPGVGKTAIMEQIAQELNIGLVSYSMTHHTRQSALGLPTIVHREYQGESFDVSVYTMSEIIAAVYEKMEHAGLKEGILFLDEINCVSETLGPSMLQFLQYKTFGNHKVPEGWVIVTAGNPPEYNRSVREFDVVTLDRLKVMEVEPDYEVWKFYAEQKGLHKAVLSYLEIRREDFYSIETTVDGKNYVTARGWEDLSEALTLYEEKGYHVDESLISQYIRNRHIVSEFAVYYELYRKYREDYGIYAILNGDADSHIEKRAQKASFDEKVSIVGLLLEALQPQITENVLEEASLKELLPQLRELKGLLPQCDPESFLLKMQEKWSSEQKKKDEAGNSTKDGRRLYRRKIRFINEALTEIRLSHTKTADETFTVIKKLFDQKVMVMKDECADISRQLDNLFTFAEKAFGDGNEMLILVSGLTFHTHSAKFISNHGCEAYYRHNKKFLLHERNRELYQEVCEVIGEVNPEERDASL